MSANNKIIEPNGEIIDVSYGANGDAPAVTGTEGITPAPTTGTDTSYAANGGVEAPANPSEILSYSEYIAEEEKRQKNLKDATYARAEEIRKQAEETARINRERTGVDAHVSYAQNMAGYGAKAESAASMGLTGGGYSDYIDAKAYATHRAEVQSSKAREESAMRDAANAEADAKYQADVSYSANMSSLAKDSATYHENEKAKEEQEMRAAFTADISAGNYKTRDDLAKALDEAGVTDGNVRSQILAQWDVWNKGELDTAETEVVDTITANIAAGAYDSREAAEQAAKDAGIANENIISQIGAAWAVKHNEDAEKEEAEVEAETEEKNSEYSSIRSACLNQSMSLDDVKTAMETGRITPDQYASIQQAYDRAIPHTSTFFTDSAGSAMSPTKAKERLDELQKLVGTGWVSQSTYDALYKTYTDCYPTTIQPRDPLMVTGKNGSFNFGNNDLGAKGRAIDKPFIKAIAQGVGENIVFGVQTSKGQLLYVYSGGTLYELIPTGTKDKEKQKYNCLHHFVFGSGNFKDVKDSYSTNYT